MTTNIKALLSKKGWTGDEVGRIMIADVVKAYQNIIDGKGEHGLLTDVEKDQLVDGLNNNSDIKKYNEYRNVHDFITSVPVRYQLSVETAQAHFWRLYYLLQQTVEAERAQSSEARRPRIVTQAEYDELAAANFTEKMTQSISVERLILDTVEHFLLRYQDNKRTPFNKYFTEAKKQPIKNQRIKDNYWEPGESGYYEHSANNRISKDNVLQEYTKKDAFTERTPLSVDKIITAINEKKEVEEYFSDSNWVDTPQAPEDATLFNVLEYVKGFYYSQSTGEQKLFYEFQADFPDLYKAIWDYTIKQKPLTFLKDIPENQYVTNDKLISLKTLYENNILSYRSLVDTFCPQNCWGLAVIQLNTVDAEYKYPGHNTTVKVRFEFHNAEKLIDKRGNEIKYTLQTIKKEYQEMYAIHALLAIISEFIDVDGLEILINPVNEAPIEALNNIFDDIDIDICEVRAEDSTRTKDEIIEELNALLEPIKISSLRPSVEAIQKAKSEISFKTFQGSALSLIKILRDGVDAD